MVRQAIDGFLAQGPFDGEEAPPNTTTTTTRSDLRALSGWCG